MRRILIAASAALSLAAAAPAYAELGNWDHVANVKDAAGRLAALHRAEGSAGVIKFLDACYRTHLLAETFTQGLESCMAQDYLHTQVLATIYSKLPQEAIDKLHAPSPKEMADGMGKRFVLAFTQYKVSVADAEEFKKLVDKYGFPIFLKAVFPKDEPGADGAGPANDKPKTKN